MFLKDYLDYVFYWNSIWDFILAILLFLNLVFIFWLLKILIIKLLKRFSNKLNEDLHESLIWVLKSFPWYFYATVYLYFPLKILNISDILDKILNIVFILIVVLQILKIIIKFIEFYLNKVFVDKWWNHKDKTTINFITVIIKIVSYILLWILILSNFWIELTPFLASFGIIWVAIAFASQKILSDIFATITLYFDKPFDIWDMIMLWNDMWKVRKIWLRSTHIEMNSWQELIISNSELSNIRIQNYSRAKKRKDTIKIKISNKTDIKKIQSILDHKSRIDDKNNIFKIYEEWFKIDRLDITDIIDWWIIIEIIYIIEWSNMKSYHEIKTNLSLWIIEYLNQNNIDIL